MLTETFVAATENVKPPAAHLSSALKDVAVYLYQFQPQNTLQQGFKKSSVAKNCLAVSDTHIFAAQAGKAIAHVYNREKGNQEATVPFPQKISSLTYSTEAAVLIVGTQDGKLMLWEVATGRVSTSLASHIDAVTILAICPDGEHVVSASPDSMIHVWLLRNLLSIANARTTHINSDSNTTREPIATFTQHRTAVQAMTIGHAPNHSTNFAISASEDKTCYIWNLSTLSILRTILLAATPLCAVLDPADRAAYIGSANGIVQFIDIYGHSDTSVLDDSTQIGSTLTQLTKDSVAVPPSASKLGAAQCITCSYDGTALITGHASGTLVRWDIAKRRVVNEITNLSSQSATNIQMLFPTGFTSKSSAPKYVVPMVIKPRPDLSNASMETGDSPIPAEFTLNARVMHAPTKSSLSTLDLYQDGFPQELLGEAIQSLFAKNTTTGNSRVDVMTDSDSHQLDSLKAEVSRLKGQVDDQQKLEKQRLEWYAEKMKRRDAVGLQKREAFFRAKKEGRNGDEAMKSFEQLEREVDDEIDEELYHQHKSVKNGNDIAMAG